MDKTLWPLAAALLFAGDAALAACENFVAIFPDSGYMVLDPGDLRVLEVGDLSWLGIMTVDEVAAGSSRRRLVLSSDNFLGAGSNNRVRPVTDSHLPTDLIHLEEMGWEYRAQAEIAFVPDFDADFYGWAPWFEEGAILRNTTLPDDGSLEGGTWATQLVDANFNVLLSTPSGFGHRNLSHCATEEAVYFTGYDLATSPPGGIRERLGMAINRDDGSVTIFSFDELTAGDYRFLPSGLSTHQKLQDVGGATIERSTIYGST